MALESLLDEIADAGWTVSWAFQFEPSHWRVSLINLEGNELKACADAPTFSEALENAFAAMVEKIAPQETMGSIDSSPEPSLVQKLGLLSKPEPIKRRVL